MNQTYDNCTKGTGGAPDLLLGDQSAWETYWLALQQNERYIKNDKGTVDILGGTDALAFRSSSFIWDEVTPDPDTSYNPVDVIGTYTHGNVYFINSEAMSFVTDTATDFITTDFVRPENQDAKVAQVMWMGAVTCSNRRKLGVLSSIVKTIVS
jgi:hypothetical protein